MKAMILCAGRGERLRPLTDETPKPLLEVRGMPVIVRLIRELARGGFRDIVINLAHLGDAIRASIGDGARLGVCVRYSPEREALDTAGGIANALPLLSDGPFAVVNGDIFCDFDFARLARHLLGAHLAHLVFVSNPPHHPQGDFALEDVHARDHGSPRWTFAGIGLYRAELFRDVTPGTRAKLAPLLRAAMRDGRVTAEIHGGEWHDIGSPDRLAAARRGA